MKCGITNIGFYSPADPSTDEDSLTMAVEATQGLDVSQVGACYFGSETHPYEVKSSAAMLAGFTGMPENIFAADLEFACKAGTSAMQNVIALVQAGKINSGLAVGADNPKADPADPLSSSVKPGAVSVLIGNKDYFCEVVDYASVAMDIADFWRAGDCEVPKHAGRFTGDGAYYKIVTKCYEALGASEFDHIVLHMPNEKFPRMMAEKLGIPQEKLEHSFTFEKTGNCFSACSLMGLHGCLEKTKPGEKIVLISYGSGAGADGFVLEVNEKILDWQSNLVRRIWQ